MEALVIKRELSSPSTPPEDRSPHDIKARLNLHVKRRLQDYGNSSQDDTEQHLHNKVDLAANLNLAMTGENKSTKERHKEVRQKRPYHKRTDKKSPSSTAVQQHLDSSTPQRKYKPKYKQQSNRDIDILTPTFQDDNSMHASLNAGGTVSAGDEDEGGQDDMRPGREKEKCPDVLAMVLSMKKRTLIQDPEVQKFLAEVMNVIKS